MASLKNVNELIRQAQKDLAMAQLGVEKALGQLSDLSEGGVKRRRRTNSHTATAETTDGGTLSRESIRQSLQERQPKKANGRRRKRALVGGVVAAHVIESSVEEA